MKKGGRDPLSISQSVASWQYFFWEDEVLMWLVGRCHPSTETFVQKDVLGVERLELRVFCCSDLLGYKVVSPKVESKTNNTDGSCPQTHNRNKQHKEMQPPLIAKRNTKDLRPETVCSNH